VAAAGEIARPRPVPRLEVREFKGLTLAEEALLKSLRAVDPRKLKDDALLEMDRLGRKAYEVKRDGFVGYRADLTDDQIAWLLQGSEVFQREWQRRKWVREMRGILRRRIAAPPRVVDAQKRPQRSQTPTRPHAREQRTRRVRAGGGSRDRPRPAADDPDPEPVTPRREAA
jgi:hypothetical protein